MDRKVRGDAPIREPAAAKLAFTARWLEVDRVERHRTDQEREAQAEPSGEDDG
jgi:hypothetical protein